MTPNFKLSKIKSITRKGRSPTMDITVKDDNSYVANNIVVHNSNRYRHITVNCCRV
jgi:intein/homing endonuclease